MAKDKTEEEQSVEDQAEEATAEVPEIEKKETETKEAEEKALPIAVVKELPMVESRTGNDAKGNEYALITQDEAMTEIYNNIIEIKKAVG